MGRVNPNAQFSLEETSGWLSSTVPAWGSITRTGVVPSLMGFGIGGAFGGGFGGMPVTR
jgi:hypothetical protein